jgi:hypothetical protein
MVRRRTPLTSAEAQYVIGRLVADRHVPATLVEKIRREMTQDMQQLQERLAMLLGPASKARRYASSRAKPPTVCRNARLASGPRYVDLNLVSRGL